MKFIFTLLPLWLLAIGAQIACAVNSLEQEFLCPICGMNWHQRIETSGHARGLRLDLRQTGDVVDPPSLPQCTKCRFPLFSERLAAQANDPSKANAFRQLRAFVRGGDFQMLASKTPSYFALAQVQQALSAPHRHIALSYLRAAWQVEGRESVSRRLLESAREHYIAAIEDAGSDSRQRRELTLLCGEIERRLGKWDEAGKRFRELEASGILDGTPQANIPALQLRLIARQDFAPHLLDGSDVAQNQPPKSGASATGAVLENPGAKPALFPGSPGVPDRSDDAMKLAQPPKPAPDPLVAPLEMPLRQPEPPKQPLAPRKPPSELLDPLDLPVK